MRRLSRTLGVVSFLACAPLAWAGDPSIVVLADGQTLEGEVTVEADGAVRLKVPARGGERPPFEVTLAPEAVEKVLPAGSLQRETLPRGVVELTDGRELRGEVLVSQTSVVVRGAWGQVEVPRADVAGVRPEEPEAPRTCADADLGLSLRVPEGWSLDEPGGVGERLRLVRDDGRVRFSVLVRAAPLAPSNGERIKQALQSDLITSWSASQEGELWRVSDATIDAAARQRPLRVEGRVELRGELAIWYRAEIDGLLDADKSLDQLLERLIESRRWLDNGRSQDGSLYRDAALRLAVEAPPGWRLLEPNQPGQLTRMESPAVKGGLLRVHAVDDPNLEEALRDQLDAAPEELTREETDGLVVVKSRSAEERGLAYACDGKTVVVVARAAEPGALARLTRSVVIIDPLAPRQEAKDAEAVLAHRAAARGLVATDPAAAQAELADLLTVWPDDPEALQLRAASLRDRAPPAEVVGALDDCWYALGSPWVAEELAQALREQARHCAGQGDHVGAGEAWSRAAEVWLDDAVAAELEAYYVGRAKAAFSEKDWTLTWAKLATARKLLGPLESLDEVEIKLRLDAARQELKDKDPQGARREARKAWLLGADQNVVDTLYAQAESLEISLQRQKDAEAARRRASSGGGLEFGIPPSLSSNRGGLRTVRASSMLRPNGRGRRVRSPTYSSGRQRRVRAANSSYNKYSGQRRVRSRSSSGTTRRVRSNGRFVFE